MDRFTKGAHCQEFPTAIATVQAHIHQDRQGLHSTYRILDAKQKSDHPATADLQKNTYKYSFPPSPATNTKNNEVAYIIIDKKEYCIAYTDITGKSPQKSIRVNQYISIAYHYDVNCILVEPMQDRTSTSITNAWSKLNDIFAQSGAVPCTYVMDNEIPNKFIQALHQHKTSYQLVPPHTRHKNIAECAIQTYKNHFKGGLASVEPN